MTASQQPRSPQAGPERAAPVRHAEALWLGPSWWLLALALAVLVGGQLAAGAGGVRSVAGWAVVPLTAVGLALLSRRRVVVTDDALVLPGARAPLSALGRAEPLDEAETARARGRGRAPGAYVPTCPWVRTSVRVELRDPADPCPHWVVPTRRPADLAAALGARTAEGSRPPA